LSENVIDIVDVTDPLVRQLNSRLKLLLHLIVLLLWFVVVAVVPLLLC
jgi:hypothetical protein